MFQHRYEISCSTTHPGGIFLPQGKQESPEHSWAPSAESKHKACRYNQHLSACFKPLNCQWGEAEDERGSLLTRGRTNWSQTRSWGGLRKKLSVFSFRSEYFRIQNCQVNQMVCNYSSNCMWVMLRQDWLFFLFLISLVSFPFQSCCDCLLPTLFTVLSRGSLTKFNIYTPPNCSKKFFETALVTLKFTRILSL